MNKKYSDFFFGRKYRPITIGLSAAATWTWAPALVLSTDIAANKGLLGVASFIIPNVLALILFAFIGRRINPAYVFRTKFLQIIFNGGFASIDFFCVLMQATAGANLCNLIFGINYTISALFLILICISYSAAGGLHFSVKTDSYQQILLIICSGIVFTYFIAHRPELIPINIGTFSIKDSLLYTTILFSGPIMTHQHWQRADKRGYLWASLFFALPLILLSVLGLFSGQTGSYVAIKVLPRWLLLLFFLMVLAGLLSSMDSAFASVSGLFFDHNTKQTSIKAGRLKMFLIGLAASVPVLFNFGIMQIWVTMGKGRVILAIILLWRLFCYQKWSDFFTKITTRKSRIK